MPIEPEQPIEGGGEGSGYTEVAPDVYEAFSEEPLTGDWELPDPENYLDATELPMSGTLSLQGEEVPQQTGRRAPLTTVSRGNGRATVRTNVDMRFNVGNFVVGRFTGTIKAGSTLTGADANNNGIPDQLEKALKARQVVPVYQ